MQITNGLLETNVLATIRRSLQERYKSDEHLKKLLLEIQEKNTYEGEAKAVVEQAFSEVEQVLHYTSLLDNLWAEIEELQIKLEAFPTYENLKKEFYVLLNNQSSEDTPSIQMQTIDLQDITKEDNTIDEEKDININIDPVVEEEYQKKAKDKKKKGKKESSAEKVTKTKKEKSTQKKEHKNKDQKEDRKNKEKKVSKEKKAKDKKKK